MNEFFEASHKIIEVQQGDLALLIILALSIGGFCTDAAFCFFKFVYHKIKELKKNDKTGNKS